MKKNKEVFDSLSLIGLVGTFRWQCDTWFIDYTSDDHYWWIINSLNSVQCTNRRIAPKKQKTKMYE